MQPNRYFLVVPFCLLLFFTLLVNPCAHAQRLTKSAPASAVDSIRQAALEDTTFAIQRLFFAKRREQRFYAILYGGVLSSLTINSLLGNDFKSSTASGTKVFVGVGLTVIAAFLTRRLLIIHRYGPHNEKRIIAALTEGKPLPSKIRRALTPNYFGAYTPTK